VVVFTLLGYTESESIVLWTVINSQTRLTQKEICIQTGLSIGIVSSTLTKAGKELWFENEFDPKKNSRVFFTSSRFKEKTNSLFLDHFIRKLEAEKERLEALVGVDKKINSDNDSFVNSENAIHISDQLSDSVTLLKRVKTLSKWG
jgi:DNA-binding transcriptional regulator GbsR (MarR family)